MVWFISNIKFFLIAGAVILGLMVLWNVNNMSRENAILHTTIDIQQTALENKDQIIRNLQLSFDIAMNSIEVRDSKIEELEGQLEGVLDDLGDDSFDQAPEAIKELLKRLGR